MRRGCPKVTSPRRRLRRLRKVNSNVTLSRRGIRNISAQRMICAPDQNTMEGLRRLLQNKDINRLNAWNDELAHGSINCDDAKYLITYACDPTGNISRDLLDVVLRILDKFTGRLESTLVLRLIGVVGVQRVVAPRINRHRKLKRLPRQVQITLLRWFVNRLLYFEGIIDRLVSLLPILYQLLSFEYLRNYIAQLIIVATVAPPIPPRWKAWHTRIITSAVRNYGDLPSMQLAAVLTAVYPCEVDIAHTPVRAIQWDIGDGKVDSELEVVISKVAILLSLPSNLPQNLAGSKSVSLANIASPEELVAQFTRIGIRPAIDTIIENRSINWVDITFACLQISIGSAKFLHMLDYVASLRLSRDPQVAKNLLLILEASGRDCPPRTAEIALKSKIYSLWRFLPTSYVKALTLLVSEDAPEILIDAILSWLDRQNPPEVLDFTPLVVKLTRFAFVHPGYVVCFKVVEALQRWTWTASISHPDKLLPLEYEVVELLVSLDAMVLSAMLSHLMWCKTLHLKNSKVLRIHITNATKWLWRGGTVDFLLVAFFRLLERLHEFDLLITPDRMGSVVVHPGLVPSLCQGMEAWERKVDVGERHQGPISTSTVTRLIASGKWFSLPGGYEEFVARMLLELDTMGFPGIGKLLFKSTKSLMTQWERINNLESC